MSEYYLHKYNIKSCVLRLEQYTWSKIRMKCSVTSSISNEKLKCSIQQVDTNDFCISINRICSQTCDDGQAASMDVRRNRNNSEQDLQSFKNKEESNLNHCQQMLSISQDNVLLIELLPCYNINEPFLLGSGIAGMFIEDELFDNLTEVNVYQAQIHNSRREEKRATISESIAHTYIRVGYLNAFKVCDSKLYIPALFDQHYHYELSLQNLMVTPNAVDLRFDYGVIHGKVENRYVFGIYEEPDDTSRV